MPVEDHSVANVINKGQKARLGHDFWHGNLLVEVTDGRIVGHEASWETQSLNGR